MRRPHPTTATVLLTGAVLLLAACGPSPSSFRDNAEQFLMTEQFLEQAVGRVTSRLTEATCTEPASIEIGEVFGCEASDAAGVRYAIGVRISGANQMEFEVARA